MNKNQLKYYIESLTRFKYEAILNKENCRGHCLLTNLYLYYNSVHIRNMVYEYIFMEEISLFKKRNYIESIFEPININNKIERLLFVSGLEYDTTNYERYITVKMKNIKQFKIFLDIIKQCTSINSLKYDEQKIIDFFGEK